MRTGLRLALAAGTLLLTTTAPAGALDLRELPAAGLGDRPYGVALGDLDGDGELDAFTSRRDNDAVATLRGDGTGGFAPYVSQATGDRPFGVALADVDGDGDLDGLATNEFEDDVDVYRNTGGTLAYATRAAVGGRPQAIATADLDGDGRQDLVTANAGGDSVSVGRNDPLLPAPDRFTVTTTAAGDGPNALAVADVDGDGRRDVVTANYNSDDLTIVHPGTARPNATVPVGDGPVGVVAADVDGDGDRDLAAALDGGRAVVVRRNDGTGTGWTAGATVPVPDGPYGLVALDADRDGRTDLAVPAADGGTVVVAQGDGAGGFPRVTTKRVGDGPFALAAGDLTGDGTPDLVVADGVGRALRVLRNDSDLVAPATTDDVGTAWSPEPVAVTLRGTDAGSGVDATYYTTGAEPPAPTTASAVYRPGEKPRVGDGEVIRYFSVDAAGNAEPVRTSARARVDATVPDTAITPVPVAGTATAVPVAFTSPAPEATFQCSLDGVAFTACASPATFPVAVGTHTVRVRAVSRAGIPDPSPAETTFRVLAPVQPRVRVQRGAGRRWVRGQAVTLSASCGPVTCAARVRATVTVGGRRVGRVTGGPRLRAPRALRRAYAAAVRKRPRAARRLVLRVSLVRRDGGGAVVRTVRIALPRPAQRP